MTRIGTVLPLVVALVLAGCSLSPTIPGPHSPAPAAGDMAQREVVGQGDGWVTFLPASPRGAILGVDYRYTMPRCGSLGPIDVDGSFWDGGGGLDGQPGLSRLVNPTDAVLQRRTVGQSA